MQPIGDDYLSSLGQIFHDLAIRKGFWGDKPPTITSADTGLTRLDPVVAPLQRNFGEIIANLHSEIDEAWKEWRDGHDFGEIYFNESISWSTPELAVGNGGKPEGVPIEFADLIIRALETCAALGIDVERAIRLKHAYNMNRAYRHGGKRA
jgi:hypothetical protein